MLKAVIMRCKIVIPIWGSNKGFIGSTRGWNLLAQAWFENTPTRESRIQNEADITGLQK